MSYNQYQRTPQGPTSYGVRGNTRHSDYIVPQQSDRVDSANLPKEEVASCAVTILTKYSKQLSTVSKECDEEKRRIDAIKFKVDDMKQQADAAIATFKKLC